MARRAALLAAVMMSACTPITPAPRVVYREVRVPVPVKATPSGELVTCADKLPHPVFVAVPPESGASSGLTPEGEVLLRELIDRPLRCIDAWKAWSR
jgi:hypothetical protein